MIAVVAADGRVPFPVDQEEHLFAFPEVFPDRTHDLLREGEFIGQQGFPVYNPDVRSFTANCDGTLLRTGTGDIMALSFRHARQYILRRTRCTRTPGRTDRGEEDRHFLHESPPDGHVPALVSQPLFSLIGHGVRP
ncbi:MAG: hypothetical protein MZV70_65775 [Desulfobacterales bacterium]|nr:hypothetical protein [Desulfobacterales bacterium]